MARLFSSCKLLINSHHANLALLEEDLWVTRTDITHWGTFCITKKTTIAGVLQRQLKFRNEKKKKCNLYSCSTSISGFSPNQTWLFLILIPCVLPAEGTPAGARGNCANANANAVIKISWQLVKAGANTNKLLRKMQQWRLRQQPFSSWNRRERCLPSGAEWRIPCVVQKLKNPPKVNKVHTRAFPSSW